MKLRWTEEDDRKGRELLNRSFDEPREVEKIDQFCEWLESNVFVNTAVVIPIFRRAWEDGDRIRANKFYNTIAIGYSPIRGLLSNLVRPLILG